MNHKNNDQQMLEVESNENDFGLIEAATTSARVKGTTHDFYRYPARFSPIFINKVIEHFTKPGDLIIDPFLGGGTTSVEARILGRRSIGIDVNSLSTFVSRVKTTPLSNKDISLISSWVETLPKCLNLNNRAKFSAKWKEYYKNIESRDSWRIKKVIQLTLDNIEHLSPKQQNFVRCGLLRTSQWALDSRKIIPSVSHFRGQLQVDFNAMLNGIQNYSNVVRIADSNWNAKFLPRTTILNRSVVGIENESVIKKFSPPKLILTSPPYPGVHILYHRWQVKGRRETPAPYWITNTINGSGASYYTFGSREERGLASYFANTYRSFKSLAEISDSATMVVQMIAFSEPGWQLPLYLETLNEAGFAEIITNQFSNSSDGRLWRQVPNRKWHASHKGTTPSSREVVLFHALK